MGESKLADDLLDDQMDTSLIVAQSQLLDNLLNIQCCNLQIDDEQCVRRLYMMLENASSL